MKTNVKSPGNYTADTPHKSGSLRLRFGVFAAAFFASASLSFAAAPAVTLATPPATIGRYDIYELTMTEGGAYTNPWEDVVITTVFTAPSGATFTICGFYYDTNTWKLRFAPNETGTWNWNLTFDNGSGQFTTSGSMECTASSNTGFLRVHPQNPRQFITEGDGKVFHPNGYNATYGKAAVIPLRGSLDDSGMGYQLADSSKVYRAAGLNMIRENQQNIVHTATFNSNNTGKNIYKVLEGKVTDEHLQTMHNTGMKVLQNFVGRPTDAPLPGYNISDPVVKKAFENFHRYMINRYGAYADAWEIGGELGQTGSVPQTYMDWIGGVCQTYDPYHHFLTINYILSNPPPHPPDESMITMSSSHYYDASANNGHDRAFERQITSDKAIYTARPILIGEAGSHDPYGDYDPERYRLAIWTAFTNESGILFWLQLPKYNFFDNGLSNQYIGSEERGFAKILANLNTDFDPLAVPVTTTLSPSTSFRGYVLGSSQDIEGYFVHITNQHAPLTGATVKFTIPAAGMQGSWIDPATGKTLQTFTPASGLQTLAIPSFNCDIVLRIRAASATPQLDFDTGNYNVRENQGSVTVNVRRTGSSVGAVSVNFATADGLAKAGVHYTAVSGTLSWGNGDTSVKSFTVPILDNKLAEGDKAFEVRLSNPTGGAAITTNATAQIIVFEDDINAAVFNSYLTTVSKTAVSVTITVNRRGNGVGPLSVSYITYAASTGAASTTADYVPITSPGTLYWADGDLSPKTFNVTIKNNASLTTTKYFNLNLQTPASPGAMVRAGYERATVAIVPDSNQPGVVQFSGFTTLTNPVGASGYTEVGYAVNKAAGSITIPVSRVGGSTGAISATYSVIGGNGLAGTDYTAVTGTLNWASGDTADKFITVPVLNNASTVGNVLTWVSIGGSYVPFSGNQAKHNTIALMITDTSLPPVITSAQSLSGTEGAALAYSVTAVNTPTSFSATNLPAGLSLNNTTGAISGTLPAGSAALYNVTLGAANTAGTAFEQLLLAVSGTSPATPVITAQPAPAGAIVTGSATFNVIATGAGPLTYQWKKNGTNISGATTSTYTTPVLVAGDNNAQYSVVVTNSAGASVTSANALLTVTASTTLPLIATNPASQLATPGQTVIFSVNTGGTGPFTYQWSRNGAQIPGQSYSSITIAPALASYNGDTYSVVVTNSAGSVTSSNAVLTVNTPPQAVNDGATTTMNTPVTVAVLTNDSDSDGDTLTVTTVGAPSHGTTVKNGDNTITYTPAANYIGNDAFTYAISDGRGGTAGATCTISITDPLQAAPPAVASFNPGTGYYEQNLIITNSGTSHIGGFHIRLTGLPAGVTPLNATYDAGTGTWVFSKPVIIGAGQSTGILIQYSGATSGFSPTITFIAPPASAPAADPDFSHRGSLTNLDKATGRATLQFGVLMGRSYLVEYTSNLQTWQPATGILQARGNLIEWTDDGSVTGSLPSNAARRFYRMKDVTP